MRKTLCVKTLCVLSAICVAITAKVHADDAADARAIVAKSIKAAGGEKKLEKLNAQTFSETGTYYGMGDGLPYTANSSIQFPHQFKMEIVGIFTIVVNGDKGWMQMGGETREMTADELKGHLDGHYASWLATLTPLTDKQFKLATAGETKVEDRPAVGVRVSADKRRDLTMYFDKESSLLVKMEQIANSSEQGNKEVKQEIFYSDYKEVEGAKAPMKIMIKRDGEKYVESQVTEFKAVGKLEDSVFGKP
jgi:hypothetical protein